LLITAYWPKDVEQKEFPEHHVACYATVNGRMQWDTIVPPGPWQLTDHRGGYAASTPCTDGERVYVLFGSSELAALDFTGRVVWRKEIVPYAWDVAIGTSPILVDDVVLILADGTKPEHSRLIAFDRATGDVRWEKKRPEANFNHTTPLQIVVDGKPQLLIASSGALQGVDPKDGTVLWFAKNKGDVPTPAFAEGLVYSEGGRGGPGIAVDPTGAGDVTATHVKWKTGPIPEGFSSPTIAAGRVYRAHNPGVLSCFDLTTGEKVFVERLPSGFNTSSSPILTPDGRLYFATGGKSVVVKVGPTYEATAENDLGDGGAASPAVAHGRLYIKGGKNLYCIGKSRTP
jgi:outer membrane protein assembly factor BamB